MATHKSIFGVSVGGFYAFDDLNCNGNESHIFDCQHPLRADCGTDRGEAGVLCGRTPGNFKSVLLSLNKHENNNYF